MPRDFIIHNVQDVLIGPPNENPGVILKNKQVLQRINRIQSLGFSLNASRTLIKELGSKGYTAKPIIEDPQIQLRLNYLSAGIENELRLGFLGNYNFSGNPKYADTYSINILSGLANESRNADRRHIYAVVGDTNDIRQTPTLGTGLPAEEIFYDQKSAEYNVVSFLNSYLNSYTYNVAVGQFPIVELGYVADGAHIYSSGSGMAIRTLDFRAGLSSGTNVEFVIPRAFTGNLPSVLRPGDINVTITSSKYGPNQSDILDWGTDASDIKINSYSLSIPLPRKNMKYIGQRISEDRPIDFPVEGRFSLGFTCGDLKSGEFLDLLNRDNEYTVLVKMKHPAMNAPFGHSNALLHEYRGAKFNDITYNSAIGQIKNGSVSFSVDLNPEVVTTGLFMSGIIAYPYVYDDLLSGEGTGLLSGLVSYWRMEETTSTRNDSFGANHLTDNNSVSYITSGKIANAAYLKTESSQRLTKTSNVSLQVGDIDFTWAGWVFTTGLGTSQYVLAKGSSDDLSDYIVRKTAANVLQFRVYDGTTAKTVAGPTISSNQWYFFVAWHDKTKDTLNIQVDNGATGSVNYVHGGGVTANALNIGSIGSSLFWGGFIDELSLWKRLLNENERALLYNNGYGYNLSLTADDQLLDEDGTPLAIESVFLLPNVF